MKDLLKNVVHQGMKDDDDDMEGEEVVHLVRF
jgi:hypothetical protein